MSISIFFLIILITISSSLKSKSYSLPSRSLYTYNISYITQPIDHFNTQLGLNYQQRYLINDSYFKQDGAIFFYTGNEGDIEWFAQNTGFVWEIASNFNALIIFAEHRYYGESLPFGNQSYIGKNPGYMSVSQVLMDFSSLSLYIKKLYNTNAPIISFGGSYGGMLTAWWRMKYPNIVTGAVAASAPILQFQGWTDPTVFNSLATLDFKNQIYNNFDCSTMWNDGFLRLSKVFSMNLNLLTSTFGLCNPLGPGDLANLLSFFTEALSDMAMSDYPYPSNFLEPVAAWPVNNSCNAFAKCLNYDLDNASDELVFICMHSALNVYMNSTGTATCYNITSEATSDLGTLGWDYQSCTELPMPIGQYGPPIDMFPLLPWNTTQNDEGCMQRWGVKPQYNFVEIEFGKPIKDFYSNIIFSQGMLDPWRGGGVMESISDTLTVIQIIEGAHHLDLRASNPLDPEYVIEARMIEQKLIGKWINDYYNNN